MNDLVQTLLSIKNPRNNFIERPELIQGYTEEEIRQIEQKYNIPIHGQFKELLMTMGKCSGGLLFSSNMYIYNNIHINHYLDEYLRKEMQNNIDYQDFIKNTGNINLSDKQFLVFAGINENIIRYFMLVADKNDIVYEWDTNEDTVREFGTLFDFLKYYRQITTSKITGKHNNDFKELTTGHLL